MQITVVILTNVFRKKVIGLQISKTRGNIFVPFTSRGSKIPMLSTENCNSRNLPKKVGLRKVNDTPLEREFNYDYRLYVTCILLTANF